MLACGLAGRADGAIVGIDTGERTAPPGAGDTATAGIVAPRSRAPSADLGRTDAGRWAIERRERVVRAAEVVPQGAVFYAAISNLSRLQKGFADLAVAKVVGEASISKEIDALVETFRGSASSSPLPGVAGFVQKLVALKVDYSAAAGAFTSEIAFIGLRPGKGGGPLRYAMAVNIGENRRTLEVILENLVVEMQSTFPEFVARRLEHRGYVGRTLRSGDEMIVSFAFLENLLLVGTGQDTVQDLIEANHGGSRAQLAGDADFAKVANSVGRGADLFYRVDLGALAGAADDLGPVALARILMPASGILWGSVSLAGEAIREKMEIRMPAGPAAGEQKLADPPKTLAYFPVDSALYLGTSIDPARLVDEARSAPAVTAGVELALKKARDALVMGSDSDILLALWKILPAVSGEIGVGVILPQGKPPEILAVVQCSRATIDEAAAALDQCMPGGPRALKGFTYRGRKGKQSEPRAKLQKPVLADLLRPTVYAVSGDTLVIASSRRALEKAIRQQEQGRSALDADPGFAASTAKFQPQKTLILYAALGRILGMLAEKEIPSGLDSPYPGPLTGREDVAAAMPHLFGMAVAVDSSGQVKTCESHGPLGPLTSAGALALAWLGSKLPSDVEGLRTYSAANLARVGVALHLYATDFDRFPVKLSELCPGYIQQPSMFKSKGDIKQEDIDEKSDFVYVGGLAPMDLSDTIIVYDREPVQAGKGRNVLHLDGRVRFYGEEVFQVELARQAEARQGK